MFSILGFVTLLLIVMALTVDYQTRRLGELKDSQILASQLAADMLELRRNEKDFLARMDTKYLDKFDEKYASTSQLFSQLIAKLDAVSIDSTEVSGVRQDAEEYSSQFKSLANYQSRIGLDAGSGLYGSLRQAVRNAESIFKNQSDYELQTHMLMLRRAEKDFMLRREVKYLNKFEDHYEAMQATLSRSALPEENAS